MEQAKTFDVSQLSSKQRQSLYASADVSDERDLQLVLMQGMKLQQEYARLSSN